MPETPRSAVKIRELHLAAMIDHARRCLPNEACGMLSGLGTEGGPSGDGYEVVAVHCLTNADPSPQSYLVDPREQLRVMRAAETDGMEIVGCFHSHVRSPARPSRTDIDQAFYPEWIYVIVSLRGEEPEVAAFRLNGGEVRELQLEVIR